MTAQIISGTELSKKIKSDVASKIEHYRAQGKRAPGLAVILVGADPLLKSMWAVSEKVVRKSGWFQNPMIYLKQLRKQNYYS